MRFSRLRTLWGDARYEELLGERAMRETLTLSNSGFSLNGLSSSAVTWIYTTEFTQNQNQTGPRNIFSGECSLAVELHRPCCPERCTEKPKSTQPETLLSSVLKTNYRYPCASFRSIPASRCALKWWGLVLGFTFAVFTSSGRVPPMRML